MIPEMLPEPPPGGRRPAAGQRPLSEEHLGGGVRPERHPARSFTAADGTGTETDFLSNGIRPERYFRTEDAAGVVLPYDDGRLAFVAVLPDGELDAWLEGLDGETFSRAAGGGGGHHGCCPPAQV